MKYADALSQLLMITSPETSEPKKVFLDGPSCLLFKLLLLIFVETDQDEEGSI